MGSNAEYHDPDYAVAGTSTGNKTEPHCSGDEKVRRFKSIVKSEITSELRIKENEVLQFDERLQMSRRLLHQLRYSVISQYYHAKSIYLSESHVERELASHEDPLAKAEVSKLVRNVQRRIHPSVKKLLGKKEVDIEEIFKFRSPRQKTRKDYLAMAQAKNVTTAEEDCKSLRPIAESRLQDPAHPAPEVAQEPTRPKKVPRYVEPTVDRSIVTLDEATRNKQKTRYRIIIGNTSKYVPPASKADKSTHKWLLYVRGPPARPELGALVTRVSARLHDTYAPHHLVDIESPPFHISRRGWGEFPAKIELHFALPTHNKPSTVYHTIKLDRRYTGMQTLGAETIVDVWLYSTEEMLKYEYKENPTPTVDTTPDKPQDPPKSDNWLDFLNTDCKSTMYTEDRISDLDEERIKQEPDDDFMSNDGTKMDLPDFDTYGSVKVKQEYDSDKELMEINDYMTSAYNEFADEDIVMKPESVKTERKDKDRYENVENIKKNIEKRVFKYIDPNTRKIFYLELDRDIDLNKVQEIVFHPENQKSKKELTPTKCQNGTSKAPKKSISLLKPEVKNQLKSEIKEIKTKNSTHIQNDHCYSANAFRDVTFDMSTAHCQTSAAAREPPDIVEKVNEISQHLAEVARLDDIRIAVNFLLRNIPLVSVMAEHPSYLQLCPFAVTSLEKYWSLDYVKRRNMEWSRAKLICNILSKHFKHKNNIWRTKQILLFSRLHGYQPVKPSDESRSTCHETDGRSVVTNLDHPTMFDEDAFRADEEPTAQMSDETCDLTASDDEIDVLGDGVTTTVKAKRSPVEGLTALEVLDDRERSQCLFIEKKCSEIGFDLKNEDIGYGYSCSAVHKVMLSAVKSFASELIRNALATQITAETSTIQRKSGPRVWEGQSDGRRAVEVRDVCAALEDRFSVLTARHLAAPAHKHEAL